MCSINYVIPMYWLALLLPLIEVVRPRSPDVDDLWAPITVTLLKYAAAAVVCISNALASADNALPLSRAEIALVTDSNLTVWAHVGVTYRTAPFAFLAQSPDSRSRLLPAHHQIWVYK